MIADLRFEPTAEDVDGFGSLIRWDAGGYEELFRYRYGDSEYSYRPEWDVSGLGHVSIAAGLSSGGTRLLRRLRGQGLEVIAALGQAVEGLDGSLSFVAYASLINDSGDIVWEGRDESGGFIGLVSEGTSNTVVVRPNTTYPSGVETGRLFLNHEVPVAYRPLASLSADGTMLLNVFRPGRTSLSSVVHYHPDSQLSQLGLSGEPIGEGGNKIIESILMGPTGDQGAFAFVGTEFYGWGGWSNNSIGIAQLYPDRDLEWIAEPGQLLSDVDLIYSGLAYFHVSDTGSLVIWAGGRTASDERVAGFLVYQDGAWRLDVRQGDQLPDGGQIEQISFVPPEVHDSGQILALVQIDDGSEALITHHPDWGLVELARTGDLIDGLAVSRLNSYQGYQTVSRMNSRGDVTFWFELEDGSSGIGVWTLPEPGGLGLISLGLLGVVRRRVV
ncbi:MAG: hypothetical protein RLN76_00385 [Phycisphaeraceae bacterium]